jgi:hypothetical protein
MPVTTVDELLLAFEKDRATDVLGTIENDLFEFKSQPYRTTTVAERWELAKDVAAFANAKGGCIVVGVKTAPLSSVPGERADSLTEIPSDRISHPKLPRILEQLVYPELRGIQYHWFPSTPDPTRGYFVIVVPEQPGSSHPFVLRAMSLDDGSEPSRTALGIPTREGDRVIWWPPERLHHSLAPGSAARTAVEDDNERNVRGRQRIELLERRMGWDEVPVLFLQALPPPGPRRLPGLHDETGIRAWVANPPALRPRGWNIRWLSPPEVVEGGLLYSSDPTAVTHGACCG